MAPRVPGVGPGGLQRCPVDRAGHFLIELTAGAAGWRAVVGDVAASLWRNPGMRAALAGLAWSTSRLALPAAMVNLAELLGAVALPAALFAIGLFMVGKSLTHG